MRDRLEGNRLPVYQLESDLISRSCGKRKMLCDLKSDECNKIQLQTLVQISQALECLQRDLRERPSQKSIRKSQVPPAISDELLAAVDDLIEVQKLATWRETGQPVFTAESTNKLRKLRLTLASPIAATTPDEVWEAICKFAIDIVRYTSDSLKFNKEIFSSPVLQRLQKAGEQPNRKNAFEQVYEEVGEKRKVFEIFFALRNCGAHGDDPRREQDWKSIDRFAAKLMGKTHSTKSGARLQLTPKEGNELKLYLLRDLRKAIAAMNSTR